MRLRVASLFGDLRYVPSLQGMRRFGVPPGGAFDRESAALAAALVDAPIDGGLELAFGQASFSVEEGGTVAVVGAGRAERRTLSAGETWTLAPLGGARLAIAVPGGWNAVPIGADPERSLRLGAGSLLESSPHEPMRDVRLGSPLDSLVANELRVVAGPQRSLWTGSSSDVIVAPWLDRHGVRLHGAPTHTHDFPSEPCLPGVIQWTPGGELIALGPDGPTIGGYPKPFVVIDADLSRLGQLLPGRPIDLVELSLEAAREANRVSADRLARRVAEIRLAR